MGIVGDIAHSRVARSNIWAMTKLGAEVTLVGPPTLMPAKVDELPVKVSYSLDAVIEKLDVINMLRIQFERMGGNPFPSSAGVFALFRADGGADEAGQAGHAGDASGADQPRAWRSSRKWPTGPTA